MKEFLTNLSANRKNPRYIIATILLLIAVVVIIWVPTTRNRRFMTIGIMTFLYIALGESWNIGIMAGIFSVSHSTFFGLGVYGMTIGLYRLHLPVFGAILLGFGLNLVLALIIGLISGKLSGLYFIMAMLGLSTAIYSLAIQWIAITGGPPGLNMPKDLLMSKRTIYFIGLGIALAAVVFYTLLRRSRIGTCFITARENPSLAASLGSNVAGWRILATIISACMAGLCGSFYAFHLMSNNPEILSGIYTLKIMMVSIVGGLTSVWGPVLGSLMIILDEVIRSSMPSSYAPLSVVLYSLVLITMALIRPGGLVSFFTDGNIKAGRMFRKVIGLVKSGGRRKGGRHA
jgi:branched-chain amino acid transport system permease protein